MSTEETCEAWKSFWIEPLNYDDEEDEEDGEDDEDDEDDEEDEETEQDDDKSMQISLIVYDWIVCRLE